MTQVQGAQPTRLQPEQYYHVATDTNKDGNPEKVDIYYYNEYGEDKEKYLYYSGTLSDNDSNGVFELYQYNDSGYWSDGDYSAHNQSVTFNNETGKAVGANRYGYDTDSKDGEEYWYADNSLYNGNQIIINETGFSENEDAFVNDNNGKHILELTEDGKILWNGEEHEMNWSGYENASPEEKFKAYAREFFGDLTYYWNTNSKDIEIGQEISKETLEAALNPPAENETDTTKDNLVPIEEYKEEKWYDKIISFFKGIFKK